MSSKSPIIEAIRNQQQSQSPHNSARAQGGIQGATATATHPVNGGDNPWNGAYTKSFEHPDGSEDNESMESSEQEGRPYTLISKLTAEFVGTMFFVVVGSLSGIGAAQFGPVGTALGHGLAIFALVASFGHISGGHFNPAVTLGVALSRKMNPLTALFYWLVQLGGGLIGAFLVWVVTTPEAFAGIKGGATLVPNLPPEIKAADHIRPLVMEILLTAFLVQTVLICAVDTSKNLLAPLAIGMTVCLDILCGAKISGASMNPARSFGPCLMTSIAFALKKAELGETKSAALQKELWGMHYIHWIGPFLGAALAVGLYRTLLGRGKNRLFL